MLQDGYSSLFIRANIISGLACLQLLFVDGQGNPIELISCPKPSSQAYKDNLEVSMFEGLVNTQIYQVDTSTKAPGKV